MPYSVTTWVNGTTPALNATNLNKLTNELKAQATERGVANTLPTWTNGVPPALSDAASLNEMERVVQVVATGLSLSYTPTAWTQAAPWPGNPARNATNLNHLENGAAANRAAMDAVPPPQGTLYDQLSDFYFQPWGGTYLINAYYRVYPQNGYQLLGSGQPWPATGEHGSFPGVVEVNTIHGAGFYFRVWPEMVHGDPVEDNKSCLITDENHIWPDSTALNAPFIGKTTDVNFWFMLPSSGNPNGFTNFNGWNCLFEYHPGGSYQVNNQLGVDPTNDSGQGPNIYVRVHDGNNSDNPTPLVNYGRRPLVLDHWYQYRRVDTWSRTNGTTNAWIDGVHILSQTGVGNIQANAHGAGNYAQLQPNFGFYTGAASTVHQNEVYYADMRILVT